jgi:hypothetical protein
MSGSSLAPALGKALARLGLASVAGLSDSTLDDVEAAHALELRLAALGPELVPTLSAALALAEQARGASADGVDAPNLVWNALQEHAVDPRALSALLYHLTKVLSSVHGRRIRPVPPRPPVHGRSVWVLYGLEHAAVTGKGCL